MKSQSNREGKKSLFALWKETRRLTTDLLNSISDDQLHKKLPRPGLNTLAAHFMELGDVEAAYAESMATGHLDFSRVRNAEEGTSEKSLRKEDILNYLQKQDRKLSGVLKNWGRVPSKIAFGTTTTDKIEVFNTLRIHETFHQGQFAAFCYLRRIAIPDSWISAWALPKLDAASQ